MLLKNSINVGGKKRHTCNFSRFLLSGHASGTISPPSLNPVPASLSHLWDQILPGQHPSWPVAARGPRWGREPGPAGLKATETDSNAAPLPRAGLLSRSQRRQQVCSLAGGRRMWAVGGAGGCWTQAGRPDPTLRPTQHLGPRERWSVCTSPGTSPGHSGTLDPPPQGAIRGNFETLGIGPCWAVFSEDRVSHLRPNPHEMGKLGGTVRAAWGPGLSPCRVAPRARSGGGTGQQLGASSCVCPGMSPGLASRPVQGT